MPDIRHAPERYNRGPPLIDALKLEMATPVGMAYIASAAQICCQPPISFSVCPKNEAMINMVIMNIASARSDAQIYCPIVGSGFFGGGA